MRIRYEITNGDKVVFIFILFSYIFPYFFNLIFFDNVITTYKVTKPGLMEGGYLLALLLAYLLLKIPFKMTQINNIPIRLPFFVLFRQFLLKRNLFLILILAILPLWFLLDLGTYRYSSVENPISKQSPVLYLFIFSHIIIYTYFFWRIFFSITSENNRFLFTDLFFSVFCFLTISGTFAALMAVIFFLFTFFPENFKKFILTSAKASSDRAASFLRFIFVCFFFSFALIAAITLGSVLAKSGNLENVLADWMDSEFYLPFLYYLGERISVHYYSFSFTITDEYRTYFHNPMLILNTLVDTLKFRIDVLAGGIFSVDKPEISSVSQINFLLTSNALREGEGTAPGLLASMNYILPLPLALFFSATLLNFYAWIIDNLRFPYIESKISILGCVLFYFFTKEIFYSPLDLLLIFDEGLIILVILLLVILPYLKPQSR